jgi:hypothetical protein
MAGDGLLAPRFQLARGKAEGESFKGEDMCMNFCLRCAFYKICLKELDIGQTIHLNLIV